MADYKSTNRERDIKTYAVGQYENDQNLQKKLKKLSERPKVSQKERQEKDLMMAKAAEFVEENIPFDMIPEELRKHHFFKVGYEVALRRKKALEYQKNMGGR